VEYKARIKGYGTFIFRGDNPDGAFYLFIELDKKHQESFAMPEAEGYGLGDKRADKLHLDLRGLNAPVPLSMDLRRALTNERALPKPLRHSLRALFDRNRSIVLLSYAWLNQSTVSIDISGIPFLDEPARWTNWVARRLSELVEEFD